MDDSVNMECGLHPLIHTLLEFIMSLDVAI
jgi:hypothetical protein